jgi:hypothetical protein
MSENDKIIKCSSCCNPVEHCTCRNRELKIETNKPKADEIDDLINKLLYDIDGVIVKSRQCEITVREYYTKSNELKRTFRKELAKVIEKERLKVVLYDDLTATDGACAMKEQIVDKLGGRCKR